MTQGLLASPVLIPNTVKPLQAEALLSSWIQQGGAASVKLPSTYGAALLGDVWAWIAIGTLCKAHPDVEFVTAGLRDVSWGQNFTKSVPNITALHMKGKFRLEGGAETPAALKQRMLHEISGIRSGVLEGSTGTTRTLLEFDPEASISARLNARTLQEKKLRFDFLIAGFREQLELGYRRRNLDVSSPSGALRLLIDFLFELHSNSRQYASILSDGKTVRPSVRILRLRSHIANRNDELFGRTESSGPVAAYIESLPAQSRTGVHGLLEASISDFGPGIVDHFLASPRGRSYNKVERRHLLSRLLTEKLSSSSDPAAGDGLQKALNAAKSMGAFVSLRTGEFWLYQNYSRHDAELALQSFDKTNLTRVAGTHWQLFWPLAL